MLYRFGERAPTLIGEGHFIAHSADVIGSVTLGDESSVWFNAVIRGDVEEISLGSRTNVQDGAVLHADPGMPLRIGDGVTVGHNAMLHGCEVGDNSLIGISAVVLNRAKIGKNCIVGAGALVTEGMVIPDNSLVVGSPAVVKKALGSEVEALLQQSAEHYRNNANNFATQLEVIEGGGIGSE